MKASYCDCGQRVFFDSHACLACGRRLGFAVAQLELVALNEVEGGAPDGRLRTRSGAEYRRCANDLEYGNCNWLVEAGDAHERCLACRLNELVPALDRADNVILWTRVELAKRRLLYSLLKFGLPLTGPDGGGSLRFRIMEDRSRNPDVFETFVTTGHFDGAITINIAEADDAVRHAVRGQMLERYRTVLGHLRHESGHFYFSRLVDTPERLQRCRELFGDEREDYFAALQRHYDDGPAPDWAESHVSAYASAHPAEDFAETFAHYLHIDDALETARTAGLGAATGAAGAEGDWIGAWIELSITLNEILRSLGADDPYPFVLTPRVREKLEFMDRLVNRRAEPASG